MMSSFFKTMRVDDAEEIAAITFQMRYQVFIIMMQGGV
jgi:hypothetical protein